MRTGIDDFLDTADAAAKAAASPAFWGLFWGLFMLAIFVAWGIVISCMRVVAEASPPPFVAGEDEDEDGNGDTAKTK